MPCVWLCRAPPSKEGVISIRAAASGKLLFSAALHTWTFVEEQGKVSWQQNVVEVWVVLYGFISQNKTHRAYRHILAWLLSLSLYSSVLYLSRPIRQQGRNRVSTRSLGLTTHMKVRGPSTAGLSGLMWPPRSPLSLGSHASKK